MERSNDRLFAELEKGSISDIIIERITDSIIRGELKPGDKIPTEAEFSDNLNVSRNSVREAIKVLVSFGVLEIRRSEGTFIVDSYNDRILNPFMYGLILSDKSLPELLEFKKVILEGVLNQAIIKATDEELEHLRTLALKFENTMLNDVYDINDKYEVCMEYNMYLSGIAHNRMIKNLAINLGKVASFTRFECLEESIKRGQPNILPDNYKKTVDVLMSRDRHQIITLMDEKLALWMDLLNA